MAGSSVRDVVAGTTLELRSDRRRAYAAAVSGLAGVIVPPYLTTFLVRLPDHAEPALLLPIVLLPVLAALVWLRARRAGVTLRSDGLHEQRVLPPDRFVQRAEIASMVVLRLIESRTLRAPRQLFLRDAEGRTLFRMREASWGAEQLDALRHRLAVPVQVVEEPMTIADLRLQHIVALPWWERLPTTRGLVLTVALIVAATALLLPLVQR